MEINTFYPSIIEYSPSDISLDVTACPVISLRFSQDMDAAAITEELVDQLVIVMNKTSGAHVTVGISADEKYNRKTRTLFIKPDYNLNIGDSYLVTVLAGFPSLSGRSTADTLTWTFTVADSDVPDIVLLTPASETISTTTLVTFTWQATGSYSYQLQISQVPTFVSTVYDNVVSSASVAPSGLTIDSSFYWRVRAVDPDDSTITGAWSEVRSLAIRSSAAQAASDSSIRSSIFSGISVTSVYPQDGTSQLDDWLVRVTFNKDISINTITSDVMWVTSYHVDGASAGAREVVPVSFALVGTDTVDVSLAYGTTFATNRKYCLTILGANGLTLNEPVSVRFTSSYSPMYSSPESLMDSYGRFLRRYTIDEISYQLHRASIKANRLVTQKSSITDLLESVDDVTYDMVRYTEAYSAYCLIQNYRYELLEQSDRKLEVDVLKAEMGSDLLTDISSVLSDLEKEISEAESLLGMAPHPTTGVKSSRWSPGNIYNDASISHLHRHKF